MRDLLEINAPQSGWGFPDLREAWLRRELLYFLGRRDIVVRYKQTHIGVLWAVLQPLLLAGVFALFLGLFLKVKPPGHIPYPLFVLIGVTAWSFFAAALGKSSESTLANMQLISKVPFPRVILPLAAIIQPVMDFILAAVVSLIVMIAYGVYPTHRIVYAPLIVALMCMVVIGAGLWLSALAVRYRDVKPLVTFSLQALLFMTPVVYAFHVIPAQYRAVYAINPLVGLFEGWRWALLPGMPSPGPLLAISGAWAIVLVVTGLFYFARAEAAFADVI